MKSKKAVVCRYCNDTGYIMRVGGTWTHCIHCNAMESKDIQENFRKMEGILKKGEKPKH